MRMGFSREHKLWGRKEKEQKDGRFEWPGSSRKSNGDKDGDLERQEKRQDKQDIGAVTQRLKAGS